VAASTSGIDSATTMPVRMPRLMKVTSSTTRRPRPAPGRRPGSSA
jgi:hypothetical protein